MRAAGDGARTDREDALEPGLVLLVNAAATLMLCGLVWFVQLVHYPLLPDADPALLARYMSQHQRRTTWVVAPLAAAETISAAALVAIPGPLQASWLARIGLGLVVLLWLSTWRLQAPLYARLSQRGHVSAIAPLVGSNWVRTTLWSARALLVLALLRG